MGLLLYQFTEPRGNTQSAVKSFVAALHASSADCVLEIGGLGDTEAPVPKWESTHNQMSLVWVGQKLSLTVSILCVSFSCLQPSGLLGCPGMPFRSSGASSAIISCISNQLEEQYKMLDYLQLILVIGATGAQGMAAIDGLLESRDGLPSPYKIRALTRNVNGERAKALAAKGVECFEGTFEDFRAVAKAMDGVYGAYINTDTFTVGEMREIYAGLKIFEIANMTPSLRHYLWSGLPYMPKTRAGYDPRYQAEHLNAKGRVTEFIKGMPSTASDTGLSWTVMNTGVYMEMLEAPYVGPFNVREDGTRVFASQMEDGKMSMMTLTDVGFWTRWIFDHRAETSGQDLNVASDMLDWDTLVATFTRVTGHPAVHLRLSPEEWWTYFIDADVTPMASTATRGDGSTTVKENYTRWWALYRDGMIERDMDWIKSIHPGTQSTEMWMRETGYTGIPDAGPLKGSSGIVPNLEKMKLL